MCFQVDKLSKGKDYYFRVIAVNENGNGDAIETAKAVKIKSAFSTYTNLVKMTMTGVS